MLSIDDIFQDNIQEETINLSFGVSYLDDLLKWVDKFNNYLLKEESSINTVSSYNDVLKALIEYSELKLKDKKTIAEFSEHDANDFLLWMEDYRINKEHGDVKKRIGYVLAYIQHMQKVGKIDLVKEREDFLSLYTLERDSVQYSISNFEEYYYCDEVPIGSIDNAYVKRYIASLPKAAVSTMMHRRAVLHKLFMFISAETESGIFKNVLKNMKIYKKQKGYLHSSKSFDEAIIKKLMVFIEEYISNPGKFLKRVRATSQYVAYRNTAMVLLMMGSGCRASEALALKFSDIVDEGKKVYKINIRNGKGNKQRSTYIRKELFSEHFNFLLNYTNDPNAYISKNINNRKLNRINLYSYVEWMFEMIDEKSKGLHAFRHEFGSNFASKNGNIKVLQELLGHYSINTTMIYSTVGEKAKEDAIEGLI